MSGPHTTPAPRGLPPLDTAGILWVAAIDRVPILERIEWVKTMEARVAEINRARAAFPKRDENGDLPDPPGAGWAE